MKLRASYGTGIANPTFFELFGFISGSFDPNPALKPEESRGFDIGADFAIADSGRLSITYFDANLENEIVGTFDSTTFRSSVANLSGKSKRRGFEIGSTVFAERRFSGLVLLHVHGREAVRRAARSAPPAPCRLGRR